MATQKVPGETDEEAIRACFKQYQAAVAKRDGKAAAALVSKPTLAFFGGILNNALYGQEAKVRKLDFFRRMMVLYVRQELYDFYKTNGYSTNAADFFALVIERGYAGQVGAGKVELGKITMHTDVIASASGVLDGQVATPAVLVFERTTDGWKFSLLDIITRIDQLRAERQKIAPVDEDEGILKVLQARTGRPIRKDIWKPIRAP